MAGRCRSAGTPQVRPCSSCALSCAHGKTGVGRPAQPARGMPRAHAADTPHSDTAPPLTDFRCLMDLPRAWMNLHRNRICRQLNEEHPRVAWIYVSTKVDTYQQRRGIVEGGAMNLHRNRIVGQLNEEHPRVAWIYVSTKVDTYQEHRRTPFRQIAENCRRRGGSGCGGVRGMDAAAKPPWMGLRRPPQPDPPRLPSGNSLLIRL